MCLTSFKKAPLGGAFFVGLTLLVACANSGNEAETDLVEVKKVIDGDTLILQNEDTVRLVGVNTPEMGHGKFPDEPLARDAYRYLKQQLEGKAVRIDYAQQAKDRHGRWLAHLYTKNGENIQIKALEQGLGFAIAVGTNLDFLDQYLAAESRAKSANKGVWGERFFAPVSASEVTRGQTRGYRQVLGKVERVSQSRKNQTLHLEGDFRVLVPRENWRKYFDKRPKYYAGKNILARGWVFKTHDIVGMKVYHPAMLRIQ